MLGDGKHVEATYKVLVLGDRGVGKTSLLNSLTGKPFQDVMLPTVGMDFVIKDFDVDGAVIQLVIWDSTGQGRLRSMTKQQYKDLQGLILVYDVTNEATLDILKYWTNSLQHELCKSKGNYEPTPMIVCGNKCDLSERKQVSSDEGQKFSDDEMAFGFYEMSARTGENVHTAFQSLAYQITDICNPKLMKSYHPHCERSAPSADVAVPQVTRRLREFKGNSRWKVKVNRPDNTRARTKTDQNTGDHTTCGTNISSHDDATSCPLGKYYTIQCQDRNSFLDKVCVC